MAKILANTITGANIGGGAKAPYTDPGFDHGRIGAALAAGARAIDVENANIERNTRQRIGNIQSRTREMQNAIGHFAGGVTSALESVEKVLDRRADEAADAQIADYTLSMLAGREQDYATPLKGDIAAGWTGADDGEMADGPYQAVARRIAAWNDTDAYKGMSERTRRKFEEKRQRLDQTALRNAMTQHVALQRRERDAAEDRCVSAMFANAVDKALTYTPGNSDDQAAEWVGLTTEAIDKAVSVKLKRERLADPDGNVLPGREEDAALIRQQVADQAYVGIWKTVADRYVQSEDPSEREALMKCLEAQVAQLKDGENSPLGFSAAAAATGRKIVADAKRQQKAHHEAGQRMALDTATDLAFEKFSAPGSLLDERKSAAHNEALAKMDPTTREAYDKKVEAWRYGRDVAAYEKRIWDAWKLADADAQKQAFETIEAEARNMGDPKIGKAVMSMLSGARPSGGRGATAGGEKYRTVAAARLALEQTGLTGSAALDWLAAAQERGWLPSGAWDACYKDITTAAFQDVDKDEIFAAARNAGLNLEGLFEIDENTQKPKFDKDGKLIPLREGGVQNIVTGYEGRDYLFRKRYFPPEANIPQQDTAFKAQYVKIAEDTLIQLYETCARWKAMEKTGLKHDEGLADFIRKMMPENIRQLNDAALRASIREADMRIRREAGFGYLAASGQPDPLSVFNFREDEE